MRVNLSKALLLSLGSFVILGLQQVTDWFIVTFSGIRGLPFFIDLGAVLKSSDCEKIYGWGIYDPSIAEGCSYIYGSSLIRLLQFFQLTQNSTYLGGWVLLGLFSIFLGTTLLVLNLKNSASWFLACFILLSPPTMLLLERANIDILIVLLMAIFSYALTTNRNVIFYAALFISSVSKFYTTPLFGWLALTQRNFAKKLLSILFFLIASILIVVDISRINGNFPRNSWASFGNPIFGIYFQRLGYDLPARVQDFMGILMLLATYFVLKIFAKTNLISIPKMNFNLNANSYICNLAQTFALIFLLCYFASASYDYRLIFLFIPALFLLTSGALDYRTKLFFGTALVLTAWLSYNSNYLQILGDLAILPWVVVLTQNALNTVIESLRNFMRFKSA